MKKRFFRRLLTVFAAAVLAVSALPAAAWAGTPALSFGAEKLTPGSEIVLGQDDFGDSLFWKILDNDGQKALVITRNTVRMNWTYGDTQFWFIDEDRIDDFGEDWSYPVYSDWNKSLMKKLCGNLLKKWQRSCKAEAALILPVDTEETENYRGGRFDIEFEPVSVKGESFFLLSAKEADQFFAGEADRAATDPDGSPVWWWLRSPVRYESIYLDKSYIMCTVDDAGWLNSLDILQNYTMSMAGFRPACFLDGSKILLMTAVQDAGRLPTANEPMQAVPGGDYDEWKLTLLDKDRAFAVLSASQAVQAGGLLSISYEGAKTGSGEVVSVVLCDQSGTPLYCGNVAAQSSGTAEFTLPAEIAPGEYTAKVYQQTRNSPHVCDEASAVTEIALTVR